MIKELSNLSEQISEFLILDGICYALALRTVAAAAVIIHQARGLLKTTRPSFLGPRLGLRAAAAAVRREDAAVTAWLNPPPLHACYCTTTHYSRLYYSSTRPPSDQNGSRPSFAYGGNFFEIRPSYERRN